MTPVLTLTFCLSSLVVSRRKSQPFTDSVKRTTQTFTILQSPPPPPPFPTFPLNPTNHPPPSPLKSPPFPRRYNFVGLQWPLGMIGSGQCNVSCTGRAERGSLAKRTTCRPTCSCYLKGALPFAVSGGVR